MEATTLTALVELVLIEPKISGRFHRQWERIYKKFHQMVSCVVLQTDMYNK